MSRPRIRLRLVRRVLPSLSVLSPMETGSSHLVPSNLHGCDPVSYRSFFIAHFAEPGRRGNHSKNVGVNLKQAVLFTVIHKQFFTLPLLLIIVLSVGLFIGYQFLKTRNIYRCIVTHALVNSFALTVAVI